MRLGPGLSLLVRSAPKYFALSVLLYASINFLRQHGYTSFRCPWWTLVTLPFFTIPLQLWLPAFYCNWKNKRARAAMGVAVDRIPLVRNETYFGLGMLKQISDNFEAGCYPSDFYLHLPERHGTVFHLQPLLANIVMTTEPAHVKTLLATRFDNFVKGEAFISHFGGLLGNGIFNSDGDLWKFHRNLTRPFFSKDRVTNFEIFNTHAEKSISVMRKRFRAGYSIDFQDLAGRFMLDSAAILLLGKEMNSLGAPLPYPHNSDRSSENGINQTAAEAFVQAFGRAQRRVFLRDIVGDIWPFQEMFKDLLVPDKKIIDAFIEPVIEEAVKRKEAPSQDGMSNEEDPITLLDELVRKTDDSTLIRDETINILVASRDTTGATLTLILYMLAEHPAVLEKLRKEILDAFGHSKVPTSGGIKELKYLRAVINETLRLYPPVPLNLRHAKRATTFDPIVPGGKPMFLGAHTTVVYSVFMMHRRKDLWGPDALEFDPDRFLDDRLQKYLLSNPYIFIPFNSGPRICLGQEFAYNQLSFYLIKLLQRFSNISLDLDARSPAGMPRKDWAGIEGRQGKEKVMIMSNLTIFIRDGLWVRMEESKDV